MDENTARPHKVLIIEDDPHLSQNIKAYLELKDYEVQTADNGEEGLKMSVSFAPDLVVSDVIMPELDGYSMFKQLQQICSDTPVIIITAKEKLKDLFALEGVSAFFAKPFDMSEFEAKIAELIANT